MNERIELPYWNSPLLLCFKTIASTTSQQHRSDYAYIHGEGSSSDGPCGTRICIFNGASRRDHGDQAASGRVTGSSLRLALAWLHSRNGPPEHLTFAATIRLYDVLQGMCGESEGKTHGPRPNRLDTSQVTQKFYKSKKAHGTGGSSAFKPRLAKSHLQVYTYLLQVIF